jgi:hypothetical protein
MQDPVHDKSASAWVLTGLPAEYKISNIRELLGHKVDLNFIEKNAAVRLDKE